MIIILKQYVINSMLADFIYHIHINLNVSCCWADLLDDIAGIVF